MRCLADAFNSLGNEVMVVAPHAPNAEQYDLELPYRVIRYHGSSRAEKLFRIATACARHSRSRDDYLLAALWFPGGLAATLVPERLRGRLGILAHGSEISKAHGFRLSVMRYVVSRAHAVVANSAYTKSLLERAGITRDVALSPCGVEDFRLTTPRSASPQILAAGRLVRRKGFDKLLEALPAVLRVHPNVTCEIVGDGPERADLEQQASSLGIESAVRFLGAVDDFSLQAAYARAWCFALPARRLGDDVEGFGIVYLEAAIAGIPAIGGRDSGASGAIVHGDTGYLVDGSSSTDIAEALLRVFADRVAARDMGQRARERAIRDFSWRANALRIDALMTVGS